MARVSRREINRFLALLREGHAVVPAAHLAGTSKSQLYRLRARDPGLHRRWKAALHARLLRRRPAWTETALAHVAAGGSLQEVRLMLRRPTSTLYRWRERDPTFASRWVSSRRQRMRGPAERPAPEVEPPVRPDMAERQGAR